MKEEGKMKGERKLGLAQPGQHRPRLRLRRVRPPRRRVRGGRAQDLGLRGGAVAAAGVRGSVQCALPILRNGGETPFGSNVRRSVFARGIEFGDYMHTSILI